MMEIAILASGRGSNAAALWEASKKPDSHFQVTSIMSDNPESQVLKFAKDKRIKHDCATGKREEIEEKFLKRLEKESPDLICLAGYMRILSPEFIDRWQDKIINIHPSLLPKYKGLNTHQRVLQAREKTHGATVHYVNEKLDDGPIIAQDKIPVETSDTVEALENRLLHKEHKLYVNTVLGIAEKQFDIYKQFDKIFKQLEQIDTHKKIMDRLHLFEFNVAEQFAKKLRQIEFDPAEKLAKRLRQFELSPEEQIAKKLRQIEFSPEEQLIKKLKQFDKLGVLATPYENFFTKITKGDE